MTRTFRTDSGEENSDEITVTLPIYNDHGEEINQKEDTLSPGEVSEVDGFPLLVTNDVQLDFGKIYGFIDDVEVKADGCSHEVAFGQVLRCNGEQVVIEQEDLEFPIEPFGWDFTDDNDD